MSKVMLRAALFDWDGTLVDSAEASYRCYVRLFESFGIAFDRMSFEKSYSPNWYRTYAALGLPQVHWAEADGRWLRFYAEESSELVLGARESLGRIRGRGLSLGLVTSGDRERVARELVSLELHPLFGAIVCGEDTKQRKPAPEALLLALSRLQVGPQEAAYVGDSPEDVEMARAAGVYSVGIPGRFPNQAALKTASPDLFAADLASATDGILGLLEPV